MRGLPIFDHERYEELRRRIRGFPPAGGVPSLHSRDAMRLLQRFAPGRVLGPFPDPPRLRRSLLLASDFGDLEQATDALEATVSDAWSNDRQLRDVASARAVTFYLDLPGTPDWSPVAEAPGVFSLCSREGPFVTGTVD
jgi:hypothetical protein